MSDAGALLQQRLDGLRQRGAPQRQPLLWGLAEALARRAAQQSPLVQQQLLPRLQHWLQALELGLESPPEPAPQPPAASGLAPLLQQLSGAADTASPATAAAPELKAMSQSRSTWARLRVDRQLQRSRASVPAQAGPLNSQRLVLQTLQTLRQLSPDYLDALLLQLDALAWLESSQQSAPAGEATNAANGAQAAARRRPRKPGLR